MLPRPPVLEIARAEVFRGETRVFADLSLTIPAGRHTTILGPNGAGKTTLLKLVTRELYPVDRPGTVLRLLGQADWNVWDLRARLGLVSHDLHNEYLAYVRGRDVVLSGLYASIGLYDAQVFSAEDRKRADETMAFLGITALADRPYGTLSTGEQRRCLLGRALINRPDTLILDEPTGGLDLQACFQYLSLVRRLMAEGRTVLLVTHHLHEIPPEIDEVVLLKAGAIVEQGRKAALLTSERISALFETPVRVLEANGWYQAVPADKS
jgi:iron complex transport system ATP-binding protein